MLRRKTVVILNEQHKLLPLQIAALELLDSYEIMSVPAKGWTVQQQYEIAYDILHKVDGWGNIVFASPVPVLLAVLSTILSQDSRYEIYVFHNDKREKKELSNGRIIYTVAQEGWQLVSISRLCANVYSSVKMKV